MTIMSPFSLWFHWRWLGREGMREHEGARAMFKHPHHLWVHSNDSIFAVKVWMSPPHIKCTNYSNCTPITDKQISFVGPHHFPKILGQKGKTTMETLWATKKRPLKTMTDFSFLFPLLFIDRYNIHIDRTKANEKLKRSFDVFYTSSSPLNVRNGCTDCCN